MNIQTYLSPLRLWFLFKRDINRQWKDYLITMSAFCGFFLISLIITSKVGSIESGVHYAFLSILIYVLGFILASMAFRDAHKKLLNHDWLMLPASTLEKFVEKLVLYSVVLPVVTIVFYTVFSLIGKLIIQVFMGEYFPLFNIANGAVWQMFGYYVIAVSIFILGAAWFKNNNFIKTIVALVVFSIILSIVSTLIVWLVFNDYFWPLVRGNFHMSYDFSQGFDTVAFENFGWGLFRFLKFFCFWMLAPICWVGAWLKLREVEVKDGV